MGFERKNEEKKFTKVYKRLQQMKLFGILGERTVPLAIFFFGKINYNYF